MRSLVLAAALAAAAALSASCSGNGGDANPRDASGESVCRGELSEVGTGCPATFDGSEAALPACGPGERSQGVWSCQDLILLFRFSGLNFQSCYYDASSHALVGAEDGTDVATYCGGGSPTIEAGRTAPMCRENAPAVMRDCVAATRAGR